MGVDDVCLSDYQGSSTCVASFNFFIATNQTSQVTNSTYDGYLGFAPPYPENGPSYVEALMN